LYFVASAVAVVAFGLDGYCLPAIVSSSVVGILWIYAARGHLRRDGRPGGALKIAPFAIGAALLLIPAVAITTRTHPALASRLVHSFLSLLFFLVAVPAALSRVGTLPSAPGLLAAGVMAAVHLGLWPHPIGAVALVIFSS